MKDASSDGTVYVLYNNEFVKATSGTIPAGRAYLVVGSEAGARLAINRDEKSTGITAVEREAATNVQTYDLLGRRVSQVKSGIYIQNGKKVVLK